MKKILVLFLVLLVFHSQISPVYSHSGLPLVGDKIFSFVQEPKSPLKGENVKITITVIDKDGHHVQGIEGELTLKMTETTQFKESPPEQNLKEIFKEKAVTDENGEIYFERNFDRAGTYDLEFMWEENGTILSTGHLIQVIETGSLSNNEVTNSGIWFMVGIALIGFAAGSAFTFGLSTLTLHTKK